MSKLHNLRIKKLLLFSIFPCSLAFLILFLPNFIVFATKDTEKNQNIFPNTNLGAEIRMSLQIGRYSSEKFQLPTGYFYSQDTYSFIDAEENILNLSPGKGDIGSYVIIIPRIDGYENLRLEIEVLPDQINTELLKTEISSYLGEFQNQFGIYIYDFDRELEIGINENEIFSPASIAKLPVAVLVLKDVDSGLRALEETFPVTNQLKFSTIDSIGALPNGTQLTIDTYLDHMIRESNNTAWYHLDQGVLESKTTQRTVEELGLNPFFNFPHEATPRNVGTLMRQIYNQQILEAETNEYLLNLLKNVVPSLRDGVEQGIPANTHIANKIGFLNTPNDLSYQDAAIVWGERTDYVIIIMNKNTPWDKGVRDLEELSRIVYRHLN